MTTPVEISDARRVAFAGLIDYAGLFPPAGLDMEGAVAGYRAARRSAHSWMVDRFIAPASRLVELAAALSTTMTATEEPWRLSVVGDLGSFPDLTATRRAIEDFGHELRGAAQVEMVEVKLPADVDAVAVGDAAAPLAVAGAMPFFEMPPDRLALDEVAEARGSRGVAIGAKLRCGGVTADLFPSPRRVADFIAGCVVRQLPFKCTAGLHHPVRHVAADTGFVHHGFLNLAAAATAAATSEIDELVEIIEDTDPSSFTVTRSGLAWRDLSFGPDQLATMRSSGFVGYGSCDFDEPVADLVALEMLP